MDKAFRYLTGNRYGDFLAACEDNPGVVWLTVGDDDEESMIRVTRSDLTAIIEKLTALRDGV